jgi:hypothetical protein
MRPPRNSLSCQYTDDKLRQKNVSARQGIDQQDMISRPHVQTPPMRLWLDMLSYRLDECCDGVHVQVVRRLIQNHHVRTAPRQQGEGYNSTQAEHSMSWYSDEDGACDDM